MKIACIALIGGEPGRTRPIIDRLRQSGIHVAQHVPYDVSGKVSLTQGIEAAVVMVGACGHSLSRKARQMADAKGIPILAGGLSHSSIVRALGKGGITFMNCIDGVRDPSAETSWRQECLDLTTRLRKSLSYFGGAETEVIVGLAGKRHRGSEWGRARPPKGEEHDPS